MGEMRSVVLFPGMGGEPLGPEELTVDDRGRLYITDSANDRVVRVDDMTGAGWTALGRTGAGRHEFVFPTGIALDGAGRIYVTDENHRVVRMADLTGAGWSSYGTMGAARGSFFFPSAVAVVGTPP